MRKIRVFDTFRWTAPYRSPEGTAMGLETQGPSFDLLLGRGLRFFAEDVDPCELALVRPRATTTGLHFNTYRCVGPMQTA